MTKRAIRPSLQQTVTDTTLQLEAILSKLNGSLDAKLSDFGASRFLGEATVQKGHFSLEEGRGRGTPPYSAPEMFASASPEAHYGPGIDVYSLGVSLYVIGLTAQEPFYKLKSMMEMIVWIKKGGFWLWEDQGWVHDRGPIPKTTPSSRLSTSSASLAQASLSQGQDFQERRRGGPRSSRSSSTSSTVILPNLPPINTQLAVDKSASVSSSTGIATSYSRSPLMVPTTPSHLGLSGQSPERSTRSSQPSTPVSPLPLPSPITRAQTPRSGTRREDQRKSGETIMRFLNGEVVQPEVMLLLKDMCHSDPDQRPSAKVVLARLEDMLTQLDSSVCEDEEGKGDEEEKEGQSHSIDINMS
ncbi:hypothetical protein EDD11_003838 [Mortierella claussenii]|nr:hypothetical protein EDD11_003838 [Mortierella claussenii]